MSMTLYDAFVPSCRQVLAGVANLLEKAEAHCAENGWEPAKIINAKLAPDMLDFATQIRFCHAHSALAVEAVLAGEFSVNPGEPMTTFAELKQRIADALAYLEGVDPGAVEAKADAEVVFKVRDIRMEFSGRNYLLSFAQPNFYFHATAAYAILRGLGVQIGKNDYLGALRFK